MKSSLHISLILLFSLSWQVRAQAPQNGSLVIAGGGILDPVILERFVELAGGPESHIVVIPTASASDSFSVNFRGLEIFRERGVSNLSLLHTRNRTIANTDSFTQVIDEANGVWFTGGRQWRLADSYLNTQTEKALWDLLERGGVIGGSSAGATIQGSYLARGDTQTNTIMMGDHEKGFGFLQNTAIDQHLLRRNRHWDLLEILNAHPELLGIGIDENTAIVVENGWFEVIGSSYVAIYDRQHMIEEDGYYYFLSPGDTYHFIERRPCRNQEPLERVTQRTW